MSPKHTPQIALANARRAYEAAQESCPHWDFESNGMPVGECCYHVDETRRALRKARKAAAA